MKIMLVILLNDYMPRKNTKLQNFTILWSQFPWDSHDMSILLCCQILMFRVIYFSHNMDHKHRPSLHLVFNNEMWFVPKLKKKQGALDFERWYVCILYFMGNFRNFQDYPEIFVFHECLYSGSKTKIPVARKKNSKLLTSNNSRILD